MKCKGCKVFDNLDSQLVVQQVEGTFEVKDENL